MFNATGFCDFFKDNYIIKKKKLIDSFIFSLLLGTKQNKT